MRYQSALFVFAILSMCLLSGCGSVAATTTPSPTSSPATTTAPIPLTIAATISDATSTVQIATSAPETTQTPPSPTQTPILAMATPLCSIMGVEESVTHTAQALNAEGDRPELIWAFYMFLLLIFFVYTYPIARWSIWLEKKYAVMI